MTPILAPPADPPAVPPAQVAAEHMELARRIAELELKGRGREQHRLWIDLENALYPTGPYTVAFSAAADLIALAREEQRERGER